MSDLLKVDDSVSELAGDIATHIGSTKERVIKMALMLLAAETTHLGSTKERVIKMALMLLAAELGIIIEIPRKEKEHAG